MSKKLSTYNFAMKAIVILTILFAFIQSQQNPNLQAQSLDILSFQKSHIIEVLPNVQKVIQINKEQLLQYITEQNESKLISSFLLQCKSILRIGQILVTVYIKTQSKPQIFKLYDGRQVQESAIFKLNFLSDYSFAKIDKILVTIISEKFTVVNLALLNNQISDNVSLMNLSREQSKTFGMLPVWLPFSYDPENDKLKQMIKYFYFRAGQHPIRLRISRIKGHPKIYLYNCQTNRLDFCKQEIESEHIDGTLMLQKQIDVEIRRQPQCRDCVIILAFKNMGAQTSMQITEHSSHENLIISKDLPIFYDLKKNSSLQILSYYNFPIGTNKNNLFLDFSFIEGNSSSVHLQNIQIEPLFGLVNRKQLTSKSFVIENRSQALRIKLNSYFKEALKNSEISSINNEQIWYKIKVMIISKTTTYFTVVDRNIPAGQQNFISLKDGQIFHSYMFTGSQNQEDDQHKTDIALLEQNFKVKVPTISTITITTYCSQFNELQISFYGDSSKVTKLSPKVYVQNITHHKKKCSQLIHLNPLQLFKKNENSQNQKEKNSQQTAIIQQGSWVYIKLSGIKNQVDLLYSNSDIILLQKSFPYHAHLPYNHALHFYVPTIKNQAIIKIRKCSDCPVSISFSEEQLADLKTKRFQPIINKQLSQIQNDFIHTIKGHHGLYLKVQTNNFAHFVITVDEISQEKTKETTQKSLQTNSISYSLEENNQLVLEFSPPNFIETNNLNSPTYYSLIEGSINAQVSRETYCPEFIFSEKEKTRDVSINQIIPELINDPKETEKLKFTMELKHHDFFGIRAQKGNEIYSYTVVNISSMKEFAQLRWSIFYVILFLTFALFMSFVCFMALKKKKVKKIGGQVVELTENEEQTSMVRLN